MGSTAAAGVLAALALLVVLVVLRERWVRWWGELEDPLPLARFRIALAFLLLVDVNAVHPWFDFLFEPDGLFTVDEARRVYGMRDPGILHALLGFVSGHFSILHYFDAFHIVLVLFEISGVLFLLGFRTRLTGILTLLLFDSILMRSRLFQEGTEVVFRVFLVYLVCSRCGATLSVDAWIRRKRGDTSTPLVPAWPRRLMMVQLSILMLTTGLLKHEGPWLDGDAVYYALTYDHYTRFRIEGLLAHIGQAPIVLLTVGARSLEVFFSFALVGIIMRWSTARFAPLKGRPRIIVHVALLVALACTATIVLLIGKPRLLPLESAPLSAVVLVVVLVGIFVVWTRERAAPLRRLFDRRLWLAAAAALFCGMWLLMNIGCFQPAMLATLLPFLAAEPPPSTPLAYSPRMRVAIGVLLAVHLVAVAIAVLPLRSMADVVVRPWVWATRTEQKWGMWGVPPVQNVFLKTVVIDGDGNTTDLRTDLYAEELRPPSPLGYDRRWKIVEALAHARPGSRFPSAYARWLCREHVGTTRVELYKVTVPIPTPAENRELGGFDANAILRERATEELLLDHPCN